MTIYDIDEFFQWQHPYYDEDDEYDDLDGWWRLQPNGGAFRAYQRAFNRPLASDHHFDFYYPGVQQAKLEVTDWPFRRQVEFRLLVVMLEFDRVEEPPPVSRWYAATRVTHYKKTAFVVHRTESYSVMENCSLWRGHAHYIVHQMCEDMKTHLDKEQRPGRFLLQRVDMQGSVYQQRELLFNPNRVLSLQDYE